MEFSGLRPRRFTCRVQHAAEQTGTVPGHLAQAWWDSFCDESNESCQKCSVERKILIWSLDEFAAPKTLETIKIHLARTELSMRDTFTSPRINRQLTMSCAITRHDSKDPSPLKARHPFCLVTNLNPGSVCHQYVVLPLLLVLFFWELQKWWHWWTLIIIDFLAFHECEVDILFERCSRKGEWNRNRGCQDRLSRSYCKTECSRVSHVSQTCYDSCGMLQQHSSNLTCSNKSIIMNYGYDGYDQGILPCNAD